MEKIRREKGQIKKTTGINKKRRQRRRKKTAKPSLRGFFVCLFLFALATVATLSLTVFFLVTEIRVEGNEKYTSAEIIEASGLQLEENLFLLNKGEAVTRITTQLPYIYETKIRKVLPSVVVIQVTEIDPVGVIRGGENEILLDKFGRVLEVVPIGAKGSFPAVVGADVSTIYLGQGVFTTKQTQTNHTQLIEALKKAGLLEQVTQIDLSVPYDLTFSYEDRILVTLGDLEDIDEKLASFKLLLADKIGRQEKGELDITNQDEIHFIPQK